MKNSYDRGKYNVPKDNVKEYYIILRKELKLADLEFKREKYTREDDYHMMNNVAYYHNSDDGVSIDVIVADKVEYVSRIYFYPNKSDKENLACSEMK